MMTVITSSSPRPPWRCPLPAPAPTALTGPTARQALNPMAIAMFLGFVGVSLGITFWAARRGTRPPATITPPAAA